MSPEQARGQGIDKRTDIWAFGCVLYEMLTAQHAFARATVPDSIAAILEREPDWSALPPSTPVGLRRLLRRCLDKNRSLRLRDIADARHVLDDIEDDAHRAKAAHAFDTLELAASAGRSRSRRTARRVCSDLARPEQRVAPRT